MIDRLYIEMTDGAKICSEDFGLILKSFDAPEPEPKTYRVSVDGADGDVDMTEWAGEVRYNTRIVTAAFRDMENEGYQRFVNAIHGRRCKIFLSSDPDWYFTGRCEDAKSQVRKRVADTLLSFTCQPYKLCRYPTIITAAISESASIPLKAARKSAIPQIKLTAQCTLTWKGTDYTKEAGTYTIPQIVLTDTADILTVAGSGTITITWTDGVI